MHVYTPGSFRTTYKGLYSDSHLSEARAEARKIVHAFHKAQDRMDQFEVMFYNVYVHV